MKEDCVNNKENLIKLRELVDQLEKRGGNSEEYQKAADRINDVVKSGEEKISKAKDLSNKIKCYEALFASITTILAEIKQYA